MTEKKQPPLEEDKFVKDILAALKRSAKVAKERALAIKNRVF